MFLLRPTVTLTWYPGAVGMTDDPLVLLTAGTNYVQAPGSDCDGDTDQEVEVADILRADRPSQFMRGNSKGDFVVEEIRRVTHPGTALEDALTNHAAIPNIDETGWLHIEPLGKSTTWSLSPCSVKGFGHKRLSRDKDKGNLVAFRWRLVGGIVEVYSGGSPPTIYPDGELIAGPSSTDRAAILQGPNVDLTP